MGAYSNVISLDGIVMTIVSAGVSSSDNLKVSRTKHNTSDGGLNKRQSAQFEVNGNCGIVYLQQPKEQGRR